ncbi:MAG: hypothetical protein E7637_00815 [Ruminococcaceae bacterium]|nr:hypothetical protein [Oscillospiraceae bacterium]
MIPKNVEILIDRFRKTDGVKHLSSPLYLVLFELMAGVASGRLFLKKAWFSAFLSALIVVTIFVLWIVQFSSKEKRSLVLFFTFGVVGYGMTVDVVHSPHNSVLTQFFVTVLTVGLLFVAGFVFRILLNRLSDSPQKVKPLTTGLLFSIVISVSSVVGILTSILGENKIFWLIGAIFCLLFGVATSVYGAFMLYYLRKYS